jgi:hypothetical protein
MTGYVQKRDDLDALLREHGGLEGLARELGQHDLAAVLCEGASDNQIGERIRLWRWFLSQFQA